MDMKPLSFPSQVLFFTSLCSTFTALSVPKKALNDSPGKICFREVEHTKEPSKNTETLSDASSGKAEELIARTCSMSQVLSSKVK